MVTTSTLVQFLLKIILLGLLADCIFTTRKQHFVPFALLSFPQSWWTNCHFWQLAFCAAPKATHLLSCLHVKITSDVWERFGSQCPSASSCLHCAEWCFCMKNLRGSCRLVIWLGITIVAMIAHVLQNRTKHVLIACNCPQDTTLMSHRQSSCDDGSSLTWAIFFTSSEQQG